MRFLPNLREETLRFWMVRVHIPIYRCTSLPDVPSKITGSPNALPVASQKTSYIITDIRIIGSHGLIKDNDYIHYGRWKRHKKSRPVLKDPRR